VSVLLLVALLLLPVPPGPWRAFLPVVRAREVDRVGLFADTQSQAFDVQVKIIEHLVEMDAEWMIGAGDIISAQGCATAACVDERWQAEMEVLAPLAELHLAPGNHDYDLEAGVAAWEAWVGPRYHSFESRYACFFLVDDQVWDEEQAAWLKTAVDECERPWRILVKHVPMAHGATVAWYEERYPERYEALDVDVVISGHRHCIAAWEDGGRLNLVLPAASATRVWEPYPVQAERAITPLPVPALGYGELAITAERLDWWLYREDGLVLLEGGYGR